MALEPRLLEPDVCLPFWLALCSFFFLFQIVGILRPNLEEVECELYRTAPIFVLFPPQLICTLLTTFTQRRTWSSLVSREALSQSLSRISPTLLCTKSTPSTAF